MENGNQEIVVYDKKGEIVNSQFARIDMKQPTTILSYGGDVVDQISAILDSTAKLSIASEEVMLDEETINSISSFDSSLDESEKSKNKKELAIVKSVKEVLSKLGVDKFQEEAKLKTYKGRYDEYCRGIQLVVNAVEQQKQASLNDIELRKKIIEAMEPLINELEIMLEVGRQDQEAYDAKTKELESIQPQTQDIQNQVKYRTSLSLILGNKLNELEKSIVLYKEQIQTYRFQQNTDMQLTMDADSYIRSSAPILKAQGSVKVLNRQQAERIQRMKILKEKTNEAIQSNAADMIQNVQDTIELMLNEGISIDTLKVVDQSLRQGVELFKNGRIQKQEQIKNQRESLKELNQSLNLYKTEVEQLIQEDDAVIEVLGEQGPTRKLLP